MISGIDYGKGDKSTTLTIVNPKYIEELEQENKQLKEDFAVLKKLQMISNDILNELEEYCKSWKENDKYCYLASNDKDKCRYDIWGEVLDKIQELKEKYK